MDDGERGRGDGVDGVGPVGKSAAGSGLEVDWRRRMSVALQRGNARIILSGAARARSGRGARVYGHMSSSDLDTGAGD